MPCLGLYATSSDYILNAIVRDTMMLQIDYTGIISTLPFDALIEKTRTSFADIILEAESTVDSRVIGVKVDRYLAAIRNPKWTGWLISVISSKFIFRVTRVGCATDLLYKMKMSLFVGTSHICFIIPNVNRL